MTITVVTTGLAVVIGGGALLGWWWWTTTTTLSTSAHPQRKRCRLTKEEQYYLSIGLAPISTGTWVVLNNNNSKKSLELLETRLRERMLKMIQANPYLMGCFVRDDAKNDCIEYNTTYIPTLQDIKPLLQTAVVEGIHPDMPYTEMVEACAPYMLQQHQDKHQPFWKVVILRPTVQQQHDDDKALILVSMSHVSGDGYTYYVLWNMLLGGDPIRSFQVERLVDQKLSPLLQEAVGKQEAHVTTSLGFILSSVRGLIMAELSNAMRWKQGLRTERILLVDPVKLHQMKQQAVKENYKDASSSSAAAATTFVSTNDILTSWFFKNTHSGQCIMAMNMRKRIPELTWDMMGNYPSLFYFRLPDVQHPTLIRTAVQTLRRAVTAHQPLRPLREITFSDISLITNWATFCNMDRYLSDKDDNVNKSSSSSNDGKIDDKTVSSLPIQRVLLHLPLLSFRHTFPNNLAMGVVFRARPDRIGMLLAGTPPKMKDTKQAPFESTTHEEEEEEEEKTPLLPGGAASASAS